MVRIIIHEWRDWLLQQTGEDEYELIEKNSSSTNSTAIAAKNAMEAENQCQQIIKQGKQAPNTDPPRI